VILELVKQPGTYICTSQQDYFQDALKNQKAHIAKIAAEARDQHCCKTERMAINFDKPPKSYKDAMSRPDAASVEWYKACLKMYSETMNIVPRPKGVKALDSITRNEYKVREGTLDCHKTRWYI
jgi:hypothetical protein